MSNETEDSPDEDDIFAELTIDQKAAVWESVQMMCLHYFHLYKLTMITLSSSGASTDNLFKMIVESLSVMEGMVDQMSAIALHLQHERRELTAVVLSEEKDDAFSAVQDYNRKLHHDAVTEFFGRSGGIELLDDFASRPSVINHLFGNTGVMNIEELKDGDFGEGEGK